jgi:hypothetical protein
LECSTRQIESRDTGLIGQSSIVHQHLESRQRNGLNPDLIHVITRQLTGRQILREQKMHAPFRMPREGVRHRQQIKTCRFEANFFLKFAIAGGAWVFTIFDRSRR